MDLVQQTTSSTTTTTKTAKKIKKITTQTRTSSQSIEQSSSLYHNNGITSELLINNDNNNNNDEELLLQQQNIINDNNNIIIKSKKISNKSSSGKKLKSKKSIEKNDSTSFEEEYSNYNQIDNEIYNENNNEINNNNNYDDNDNEYNETTILKKQTRKKSSDGTVRNGKKKSKKSKKSDDTKENISVDPNADKEPNCRQCGKITYRMEEVKAEGGSWHKSCFKCSVCNKQLNVDTFESHEGNLYCKVHFKILMAPKAVEDLEPVKPKKHELIIRENQPAELPPDVVRASDKSDLGLEELQQLNVRSRFQVFENFQENRKQQQIKEQSEKNVGEIKRGQSILQKLARFQKSIDNEHYEDDSGLSDNEENESEEEPIDSAEEDPDLVRAKRAQRERPIRFDQMNAIKSKFEKGNLQTREERREERKQELQNIRSRLFLGKQARIKEQYQQAVADSEHGVTVNKKPEIDIGDKAKSLKEKFEKGEMFRETHENNKVQDEMDVFESGISKQSRSLFMELDAHALKSPSISTPTTPRTPGISNSRSNIAVSPLQEDLFRPFNGENLVKYDEKPEDIKIETSEISSKFKFFETYKSDEKNKSKKPFRITPPREGVVKMPTPEEDEDDNDALDKNALYQDDPTIIAAAQHTKTKMLNRFRELEQQKHIQQGGIKPLKRFTPPPDGNRRVYDGEDEDEDGDEEEEGDEEYEDENEEEYEDEEQEYNRGGYQDEFLKMAQSAARAKQLRAKFEKWEANEIKREMNGTNGFKLNENTEESQTESAKSLRAKFEQLRDQPQVSSNRPKIQVNRFV